MNRTKRSSKKSRPASELAVLDSLITGVDARDTDQVKKDSYGIRMR